MSECNSTRCQQDRKLIRREFNKWTKNILLQIGLETISKNHFDYDINSFNQTNDEQIPNDFNPDQICLFCINRQEYFSNNEENSPLDLSFKSIPNPRSPFYDLTSDIPPIYNQEDLLLSSYMNFDYLSQLFPNVNHFSSLQSDTNACYLPDIHIAQLAKQMAYSRMIEEIEYQRNNKKSKMTMNFLDTSSMNVNHILNDIMIRMLNETFEKQHKSNNKQNPSPSSPSSTASISSTGSSSIHTKHKTNSKSKQLSTHTSSRRPRELINNSKVITDLDGKQSRPKRGQYRRYESEQLSKAVTAVLSNEMTVHKAGSYFGVPHSTLEYKVKERTAKVPTTRKNTMSVNDTNNNISEIKSMEYDDVAQSNSHQNAAIIQQYHDENECDNEEIRSYIPIELQMN